MNDEPIAERIAYRGGFPVYLSRYVIFGGVKPHAAMRFFNAGTVDFTGIRFVLTERDAEGRVLSERTVERDGLSAERGSEFEVADAAVSSSCARVEARVEALLSGGYEYLVEKDGVRLHYGAEAHGKETTFLRAPTRRVSVRTRRYLFAALAAVLGFALAAAGLAWRFGFFGGITETDGGEQTVAETATEYVEA